MRLTQAPGAEQRPRISPGREWIAFDLVSKQGQFVHVMRADGSDIHILMPELSEQFAGVCCTDWHPDGSKLAMTVQDKQNQQYSITVAEMDLERGTALGFKFSTSPAQVINTRDGLQMAASSFTRQ